MSQQVLTVEYGGEMIISKPFDFETMCIMDDTDGGMLRKGISAVSYMFEGTKVTDAVIDMLSSDERAKLSMTVCKWFKEEMGKAAKNV